MRTGKRKDFNFETEYYHQFLGDLYVHVEGHFTATYSATLEEPGDGGECEFDSIVVTNEDGMVLGGAEFFEEGTDWLEEEAAINVNGSYDPEDD